MIRESAAAPAAGLGRRAVAVLVDGVLTMLAGGWLWVLTGVRSASAALDGTPASGTGVPSWLVALCVGGVLVLTLTQWVLHGRFGWTVGRHLLGVRTVDAATRRPLGMGRVLLRGLVVAAGSLVAGVGQLVVLLSPLLDRSGRRQGWHDLAARAVVLDVRPGAAPALPAPPPPREDLVRPGTTTSFRAPSGATPSWASPRPAPGNDAPAAGPVGPVPPPPSAVPSVPSPAASSPQSAPTRAVEPRPVTGANPKPLVLAPLAPHRAGPDLDTRALPLVPPPPAPEPAPVTPSAAPVDVPAQPASRPAAGVPHTRQPAMAGAAATLAPEEDVESTRRRVLPAVPAPPGPREPVSVAVLEISDGQRVEVRRTALVGRNPAAATDGVQLVRVVDPGRSVSKTHLQVAVEESGVWVADRGSTNGTVVTLPDGGQVICQVDQPVRLRLGSVVVFGDCAMRLVATS